jgi:hypothetical protein
VSGQDSNQAPFEHKQETLQLDPYSSNVQCGLSISPKNKSKIHNPITSDEGTMKTKVRGVVFILMPNGSSSKAQSKKMGLQTEGT